MGFLARSRAAQRVARTRIAKATRRGSRAARSTEEVDAEREAHGRPTLSASRGGLPPRARVRQMHTHVEMLSSALMVVSEDPDVFGILLTRPLDVGDDIEISDRASGVVRAARVAEIIRLGTGFEYVAIGVRWNE